MLQSTYAAFRCHIKVNITVHMKTMEHLTFILRYGDSLVSRFYLLSNILVYINIH